MIKLYELRDVTTKIFFKDVVDNSCKIGIFFLTVIDFTISKFIHLF